VEVGELVIVRLEETGNFRFLLPGLIVGKFIKQDKEMYEVLTRGETVTVTHLDLGPIDMFSSKKKIERRWNSV